jgi:serine/threonine-protein kinase
MRRYPAALRAVEREIALMPNSWRCEWLRAWTFMAWKSDLSGLENLRPEPAAEREIYTWLWFNTNVMLKRYEEAEAILREDPRDMLPGFGPIPTAPKSFLLGYVYQARKDDEKTNKYFEEALPIVERAAAESPLDAGRHMGLAAVYAGLHRKKDAIREGKRACELLPVSKNAIRGPELLVWMAFVYLRLNEPELALTLLEHSLSLPAGAHVGQLRVSPIWEPLRNNPRFQQLLTKYAPK